ncbi:MAG: hypothetical protein OK438_06395 [Thaumarchaeota archaeon]|nr:hypothetical protein [Nitrososphaerota archaeon]
MARVPYSVQHTLPLKTLTWSTIGITVVLAGLYVLLGFPPSLGAYYRSMYFHSIGIGIAALAVYLVISAFEIEKYEPKIDFPLAVRAWVATLFGAVGGLIYLFPSLDAALPDVGIGMFVVAFLLLADVGGALFLELMVLPRKKEGVYEPGGGYWRRMFPFTRAKLGAYKRAGLAYWFAISTVGSAFLAGIIGFFYLWVSMFGPSFLSGYLSYLGLDGGGFLAGALAPHSHEMATAILAGVVAIAVQQYGILDTLTGIKKGVAKTGVWISIVGVVVMTVVYLASAFANYAPPTLFAGGPGGVNGMAGDDTAMSITGLGAMVIVVPMALAKIDGVKAFWRDGLRATLLTTWVAAVLVNIISGFYLEFHEDLFQNSLFANDRAYAQVQSLSGLFVLGAAAMVLLTVDHYGVGGMSRRLIGFAMPIGLLLSVAGGLAWVFIDVSNTGLSFWTYVGGTLLIGVAALVAAGSLYARRGSTTIQPSA